MSNVTTLDLLVDAYRIARSTRMTEFQKAGLAAAAALGFSDDDGNLSYHADSETYGIFYADAKGHEAALLAAGWEDGDYFYQLHEQPTVRATPEQIADLTAALRQTLVQRAGTRIADTH